jgi:hypothetical protein
MTVPCPEPQELTRLLDGELTENRGAQLRDHAMSCARCAAELSAQERLVARLSAPLPGLPAAGALAAVMGRLDAAAAVRPPPRVRIAPRAWAGLAAAAAAAAVLAVAATRRAPQDDFTARGASVSWEHKVGVELWALQGQPRRLATGDRLAPGVAMVASYSNVDPAPAWLLAFAVDERGEVHWLYPGFLDAAKDPQALRLEGSVVQRALPESVVLEEVPDGTLRLVTVVTRAPLHVSDVESARPAERTPEALRRRWPDARVDEVQVRYTAKSPPSSGDGR